MLKVPGCIVLTILQLCLAGTAFAQQQEAGTEHDMYVLPSPDAAGLMRFANVPVDEHTGIPSINVPIDQIPGRRINVSIGLSYHAGGNKVSDIASSVGLGWVLNGGGAVTRMMRGLPDEGTNGYQYTGTRVSHVLDSGYLHVLVNNKIDGEPDEFFFNFMGHAGKMVIDTLGNAQYLPDQGIRVIQHPIHNNKALVGQAWILKDFNGYTYTFGKDASSRETTTAYVNGDNPLNAAKYISSWYLVSVVSPDGLEKVNFNYTVGPDVSYKEYRNMLTYEVDLYHAKKRNIVGHVVKRWDEKYLVYPDGSLTKDIKDISTVITISGPKYLSSITADNGFIKFLYAGRTDLSGGQMLTTVQVFNYLSTATPLKTYTLNHSYFVSTKPNSSTDPDSRRLRLDCVELQGQSSEVKQLSVFTYNLQNMLPPRNSEEYDHWGYYTTLDTREGYPSVDVFADSHGNVSYGHERHVIDSSRMQANILTRVRNQNGGYTALYYEPNDFYDIQDSTFGKGGGLRIARLETKDSLATTIPIVKIYSYLGTNGQTSGDLFSLKPYYVQQQISAQNLDELKKLNKVDYATMGIKAVGAFILTDVALLALTNTGILSSVLSVSGSGLLGSVLSAGAFSFVSAAIPYIGVAVAVTELAIQYIKFLTHRVTRTIYEIDYYAVFSLPLNNLFDGNGAAVTYNRVTVRSGDGSSTTNLYTGQADAPDLSRNLIVDYAGTWIYQLTSNGGAFPPNTSYGFARGLLKESQAYDRNNNLVSRTVNTYQFSKQVAEVSAIKPSINAYVKRTQTGPLQVGRYYVGAYSEIAQNVQLKSSYVELYDQVNSGRKLVDSTTYVWTPGYPTLLHAAKTLRSDGQMLSTYKSYPFEYIPGTKFIDDMVKNLIIAPSIETLQVLTDQSGNQRVTGGALNRYYDGGLGLLDTTYSINTKGPIPILNFKASNHSLGMLEGAASTFAKDRRYVAKGFFQRYDSKNNLVQYQSLGSSPNSIIYDYNQMLPIAKFQNASLTQVAYTSFESRDQRYWKFTTTGRDSSASGKTGRVSYLLSQGALSTAQTMTAGTYLLSYWSTGGSVSVTGGTVTRLVNGESDGNGWAFYQAKITLATAVTIGLSGSVTIDEVRLYPSGAHMSSSTYNPMVGELSTTSAGDKTNYYEYDPFQRIKRVRDDHHNILKDYTYVNVPPIACTQIPDVWVGIDPYCGTDQTNIVPNKGAYTATIFNRVGVLSCNVTRTETGYDGMAAFTVFFNNGALYSGEVLIRKGQTFNVAVVPTNFASAASATSVSIDTATNFTDSYGVGIRYYKNRKRVKDNFVEQNTVTGGLGYYIPPVSQAPGCITFYNTEQTLFWKNDCATGTGSYVEYTVSAGTDTASSQHAADIKARARGQAYANLHGTCTASDTTWQPTGATCTPSAVDPGSPSLTAFSSTILPANTSHIFIVTFSRTASELNHDITVSYTISLKDGSAFNYTVDFYKGIASVVISPLLQGYLATQVKSVTITGAVYASLKRAVYPTRIRLINGFADGFQEANTQTGGKGIYFPPLENPPSCLTWYFNTAQTGFVKNNCPQGQTGSSVSYTIPAHTDSSTISQEAANALAWARGQDYANSHGTCALGKVTWKGADSVCETNNYIVDIKKYSITSYGFYPDTTLYINFSRYPCPNDGTCVNNCCADISYKGKVFFSEHYSSAVSPQNTVINDYVYIVQAYTGAFIQINRHPPYSNSTLLFITIDSVKNVDPPQYNGYLDYKKPGAFGEWCNNI